MDKKELQNAISKTVVQIGMEADHLVRKGELKHSKLEELASKIRGYEKELFKFEPEEKLTACPSCQGEIVPDAKFCQHCSFNIQAYREETTGKCDNCGTKAKDNFNFCSYCGVQLANA